MEEEQIPSHPQQELVVSLSKATIKTLKKKIEEQAPKYDADPEDIYFSVLMACLTNFGMDLEPEDRMNFMKCVLLSIQSTFQANK